MKKILITLWFIALISVVLWFILPDITTLRAFFIDKGAFTIPLFILIQVLITSLLCFVPATSASFVALGILLFGDNPIVAFIITLTGVVLSSQTMFLLGRYGGVKIANRIVGEKEIQKAQDLMDTKTKIYLPMMYMFPIFPDDALCFVAGMTKMSFWYHLTIVAIFRGIGVTTIVFLGSNFFKYELFTLADWFTFVSACVFWVLLLFYTGSRLDKKLSNK